MKTSWLRWNAFCALVLLVASATPAQTVYEEGLLRARFGVFYPSEDELKNLNRNWFSFGLSYELPAPLLGFGMTEFSLDFYLRDLKGSRGTIVSLLVNQVFTQENENEETRFQLRFGVGMYAVDAIGPSKNLIGGRIGATLWLDRTFSIEANYDFTDRFGALGTRANGLSVTLGYQF